MNRTKRNIGPRQGDWDTSKKLDCPNCKRDTLKRIVDSSNTMEWCARCGYVKKTPRKTG